MTEMTRRDAVKTGAAAVAATAIPAMLKAQEAPALSAGRYYRANETVRVACCACWKSAVEIITASMSFAVS